MKRRYNFHTSILKLNFLLKKEKPTTFNPKWIKLHSNTLHKYFYKNVRSVTNEVDWDRVTSNLERLFQKRWKRYEKKIIPLPYENKAEIRIIFNAYEDKIYTLMAPLDREDRIMQNQIMTCLVRNAQKGNSLAKEYVTDSITFIIYEWIEGSKYLVKWKGYPDEIEKKIQGCIRNFRYSGNFMSYVFMTFRYSARGLRPTYSLDDKFRAGNKRRIDYVMQEEDY